MRRSGCGFNAQLAVVIGPADKSRSQKAAGPHVLLDGLAKTARADQHAELKP
jgi:hypothetical protein